MTKFTLCTFVCLPALLAASLSSAAAQTDADGGVQEIVVTAQKRTENARDTAVAVSVIAPEALANSGVTTIDDLGKAVPSLTALPSASTLRPFYTLRGVSTDVITIGAPSGVAVMIDGVTLAPESLAAKQLGDIASVEVLRGPQSTLGGRTASIGVINIVTREPSQQFEGNASATVTDDHEYRVSMFAAGPVTDTLSASMSAFGNSTKFDTRNIATGRYDSTESVGVRGKLKYAPTDALNITLAGNYSYTKDTGAFQAFINVDPNARFRGAYAQSIALPGITPERGNKDYNTITTPGQVVRDQLYTAKINYEVGDFTFSSLTARQIGDRTLRYDAYLQKVDFSSLASGGVYSWDNIQTSDIAIRGFSQEFKVATEDLGFGRFLAGLYYDHAETSFQFDRPAFGTPIPFGAFRESNNKHYAAYARGEWNLTDTTTLITGARFNYDKLAYIYNLQYNSTVNAGANAFTRTGNNGSSTFVGDVTLKQKLGSLANIYATYSRGYKPKVYNLDANITTTSAFPPVNKEKVDNFEVGFKGDLFDRVLSIAVAGFYTTYKNFQVQAVDPTQIAPTFEITNAGKASTRGVEVDATLRPTRSTTLGFSGAYVDAKYDSFVGANCYSGQTAAQGCVAQGGARFQDLSGETLARAPKWKFAVNADQRIPLGADYEAKLGANYSYQSKINFDPNKNPLATQDAYGILNLSVGIATTDEKFALTAFVNNVTDKSYVSNISDVGGRWGGSTALTGWYARDASRYAGVRFDSKF
ncbi:MULTISPECIES: TonB-dependent receptor [unclassified Sphingobium]|uniref:TonB-dependent receptor n=1 Tax=unclassified Sphingobium TaxID=2611147 RepID=UPI000D153414|nr:MULTISPECIES: TonB-dependent receptor [unclassified Sphingobium]MBG6117388.1 iron complex outermembrane receptor protein [Sphingobium sp. JAI105]PSO09602.1 hypothetical protein C7E20_21670 [Sphingobium sp. AEW4]TWC96689.1 iron complex outermembrane receptor protein [Sphingobium sp. AEW010]TWD16447.1 iron complex outermembrane receptor protein [Sphingobium sp. AEW013]TWD19771.1 iron complex outermembrane receptor protein [Sphingobium sp. AEW001]